MKITPETRRWLAVTTLARLEETTTTEAAQGTQALAELLAGTPAGEHAVHLDNLTRQASAAAGRVLATLDHEEPSYP